MSTGVEAKGTSRVRRVASRVAGWAAGTVAAAALSVAWSGHLAAQESPPGPSATLPAPGTPLVFVNTQVILPLAPGADSAQAQFQGVLEEFETELMARATEIDSLVTAYRQQERLMDQAGRARKEQEIVDKQQEAQARQQELEAESDRRRTDLLSPILQRITDVIQEIREEQSYSIVFDIAESGVIAADVSLDITGAVLERLGVDPSVLAAGSSSG